MRKNIKTNKFCYGIKVFLETKKNLVSYLKTPYFTKSISLLSKNDYFKNNLMISSNSNGDKKNVN
jgi:hypothetical protein